MANRGNQNLKYKKGAEQAGKAFKQFRIYVKTYKKILVQFVIIQSS